MTPDTGPIQGPLGLFLTATVAVLPRECARNEVAGAAAAFGDQTGYVVRDKDLTRDRL